MISVQSLRLQLNGNRGYLFFILIALLGSSCSLLKPARNTDANEEGENDLGAIQGKRVFDPETGTYVTLNETITETMDTVIWKDVPPGSAPPITSEAVAVVQGNSNQVIGTGQFGSQLLSSYNISVVLPFLTDRFSETSPELYDNSLWAVHFYSGLKLALEDLGQEGVNFNVSVLDSRADVSAVQSLLRANQDLQQSHLIIGPYRRDNVALVADYARDNNKTLVSPQSAADQLSARNSNYIQVSPALKTHCEAITRHVLKSYRPDQIVLVARDKEAEVSRFQYFRDELHRLNGARDTAGFRELVVSDSSVDLENLDLLPFVEAVDTLVFIIPSWSNETFIYSFLRKVDLARTPVDEEGEELPQKYIVIYGMPQWMSFERIDYDYYEQLNVHVSSSSYINPISPEIQFFRRRFFDRYGSVPREEAFLGYDVMLYFGRMMNKHGTKFQYVIEREPLQMMHTYFDFERVVQQPASAGSEGAEIQQFENKYVNILEFEGFQFQLAD